MHYSMLTALVFLTCSTAASRLEKQTVSVWGSLKCGGYIMKNTPIEMRLRDYSIIMTMRVLNTTTSDENGKFALTGSAEQDSPIETSLFIKHYCNVDDKVNCHRERTENIPIEHINKGEVNMGDLRMEMVPSSGPVIQCS